MGQLEDSLREIDSALEAGLRHEGEAGRGELVRSFKALIAREWEMLRTMHLSQPSGALVAHMHSEFFDRLLRASLRAARRRCEPAEEDGEGLALVATGGYGRGELCPHSDIDIMFLYRDALNPGHDHLIREVLYLLWDMGLNLGHACRSIEDCIALAREDFRSETSLLESRFVVGDEGLFRDYQEHLRGFLLESGRDFFLKKEVRDRNRRYLAHDASVYVQEPNVKESVGGLRDLHLVLWVLRALYGFGSLDEVSRSGLISPEACGSVAEAYDFILRVRNQLHLNSRFKNDILSLEVQGEVAASLGYRDRPESTAAEQLMRDYYLCAREIFNFSQSFLESCEEEARRERRPIPIRERQDLGDGFVLLDWNTLLHRVGKEAFSREPHLLMKAFQYQHRYGCRLGRELKEQIRGSLHLIDDAFCSSPEVRETFMEILGAKAGVAPTLRIMHELGVLGRYIPEFGRLTCFVHQDYYHRYTADEHTLVALEKLDEVAFTRESSLLEFSRLFKELERLHVLRLALLLHDIGKAKGPRHHHRSVEMVPPVTIRMGLPQDEGGLVEFLVAHHLSMSHISERRDTDDPKLVEDFVQEAGSPEKLKMLYLLTYADIAAIHPGAWTEWRGALLFELYKKCLLLMTEEASAQERRRLGDKREQVLGEVRAGGLGVTPSEVDRHFRLMPERYLLATSPQAIAQHIAMVKALSEQPLAYHLSHRRQIGYSECILCTPDHVGLFSQIAGVFALHEVSILSAQVYTRGDGIAVDTFQVQDSRGGAVTSEERWQRLFEDLRSVLEKGVGAEELLGAYRKYLKAKARGPFDVSTRVEIDNSVSEQYSVIDVQTQDRHGLLYLISKTLASLRVSIALAKITTEGVRAIDVFYVVDEEGRKIHDRERLEQLRLTLEEALGAPARSTGERGA